MPQPADLRSVMAVRLLCVLVGELGSRRRAASRVEGTEGGVCLCGLTPINRAIGIAVDIEQALYQWPRTEPLFLGYRALRDGLLRPAVDVAPLSPPECDARAFKCQAVYE